MALSKRFRFAGRYGIEFKGEAFNLTNTPSFSATSLDMDINSTTFGGLNTVNVASRVIQMSARFDFSSSLPASSLELPVTAVSH